MSATQTATPFRPVGEPVETGDGGVRVPAGTYYVGDPCYAFTHEQWDELLARNDVLDRPVGYILTTIGAEPPGTPTAVHVVCFGTAYGDGCYEDQYGNEYGVDAGLLGVVPAWFVEANGEDAADTGGHIFTFTADFTVTYRDGKVCFGDEASGVLIDTDPQGDDDE